LLTSGCGLVGGGIGLLGLFGEGGLLGLFGSGGSTGAAGVLGSLTAGGIGAASLASFADGGGLLGLFDGGSTDDPITLASTSFLGTTDVLGGDAGGGAGGAVTDSIKRIHNPEPSSVALVGIGLAAAAWRRRRAGTRRKSPHPSS